MVTAMLGQVHATGGRRPLGRGGWPLLALGAWSVLSWVGRVRNILGDAGLDAGQRAVWLVPAVVFVAGGAACLAA